MMQQRLQRLRRIVGGGDSNPLRRYVDRIESAVVVSLVVAFIVAAPLVGIFTVRLTGAAGAREVAAQSSWRQVPAVLTQSAAAGLIGLDGEWDTSWVTARWTAPDGAARHGLIAVGLNARAGQTVEVWATRTGQLTTPPLTEGAVIERQIIATVAATAALALLLSATAGAVRALANRRRMVAWTKEWKTIGPRWSSLR